MAQLEKVLVKPLKPMPKLDAVRCVCNPSISTVRREAETGGYPWKLTGQVPGVHKTVAKVHRRCRWQGLTPEVFFFFFVCLLLF